MLQLNLPGNIRVDAAEFVLARFKAAREGRARIAAHRINQIGAGLVNGHRIDGSAETDIVDNGSVGMAVTVAGRRYLGDEVEIHQSDLHP